METFTAEQFFAELEKTGEDVVRTRVATRTVYGAGNKKHQLAEEWLRRKDQERRDAIDAENLSIAKAARDAALDAAKAARHANRIATIALIVATLAIAIPPVIDRVFSASQPVAARP